MTTSPEQIAVERIRKQLEESKAARIYEDYGNALRLISQVVFTRSANFVMEFLQNAEDSGLEVQHTGEFQVYINKERVKVCHNGAHFKANNLEAICGIRSSKRPEQGTLGYLGIGFKSVFKVTDRPEVHSGGFHFKFERPAESTEDPLWHVTPIWTDTASEPVDPNVTTFIVPFNDSKHFEHLRTELSHLGPQLYLFLRWVKRVMIVDEVAGTERRLENLGTDTDEITTLGDDDARVRFRVFRRTIQVPEHVATDSLTREYRSKVLRREIALGFALDPSGDLMPAQAMAAYGGVYSFVPVGESKTGAPFPIQADFLVQPGRDAVNYEATWNKWLVDEIAVLCKEAIAQFVAHPKWRYQFLPVFSFERDRGNEGHDRLFGPHLIDPLEEHIRSERCIPTIDGSLCGLSGLVRLDEDKESQLDLERFGLFAAEDIPAAMGAEGGALLVHPDVRDGKPAVERIDRFDLLKNKSFLSTKAQAADGASWFRLLYRWLHAHPRWTTTDRRGRKQLRSYHEHEIVLTARGGVLRGGNVSLVEDLGGDRILLQAAANWQKTHPLLHPDILTDTVEEQDRLRGFLMSSVGVQRLSAREVCQQVVVPRIAMAAPKPSATTLVEYTRCCHAILGNDPGTLPEFWVLNTSGEIRAAKEVSFGTIFGPEPDWEKNKQYLPAASFIHPDYVTGSLDETSLASWRRLFLAAGVKSSPDNGVEVFAMNYAEEALRKRGFEVKRVEKQNFGYDLEAVRGSEEPVRVEVKGRQQQKEDDVELTGNETRAAQTYGDNYWVLVVPLIPESPAIHRIIDPERAGNKDKITIPVEMWREARWVNT